jgi:NAD dependent epimerase/dehydratase family enzyme
MKIVIPGGSGQVGTIVARAFHDEGHEVIVLSRRSGRMPWQTVEWDGLNLGPWVNSLDAADVLLNLTGRSVNCRYTAANRRVILDSRVRSTRVLGQALAGVHRPPRVWLQASTATIYAHRYDAANDEVTGIIGGDEIDAPDTWRFSIDVARAWEQAFDEVSVAGTRKVVLRSAMTMSADRAACSMRCSRSCGVGRAGGLATAVSSCHGCTERISSAPCTG